MPKVDTTRNYYADLQVPPSASSDDIKKQYRKLAMQWHPDRNRGREEEASKKFQTIQAAFEILTDPTCKRQYDEARNKSTSRFATASGVRGNPWANAGSQWAPPPRRANANPTPGRGGTQTRPTPQGASRYSNFTASAPHRGNTHKDDPASAKANYDAWNNMRAGSQRKTNIPPPTPGRPPTSATRDSRASEPEGVHRSASQRQKAQASFGSTSRRTGYTPRSPGLGDEPPVASNNYFTTRTHTNIFNDASASTAHSHRASAVPDPLAQFRDNVTDERQSTPYSTPGGEKTKLHDGPSLSRTNSTRQPTRNMSSEDTFPFPRQRPRSSSTPRSSSNDAGSEDSTRVNTGAKSDGRRSSTRTSDRYRPKSAHSTTQESADYATGAADRDAEGSPTYAPSPSTSSTQFDARKTHDSSGKAQERSSSIRAEPRLPCCDGASSGAIQSSHTRFFASMYKAAAEAPWREHLSAHASTYTSRCGDASSEAVQSGSPRLTPLERTLHENVDELVRKKRDRPQPGSALDGGVGAHRNVPGSTTDLETSANVDTHNSFSFGADHGREGQSAGQKRFASSSAENINTTFVDDEHEHMDGWEFKAGGTSTDGASGLRSQSGSRHGKRSPTKISRRPVPTRPDTDPVPPMQQNSDDTSKTGFSAEEWGEKIGPQHFVPQPAPSGSASPTRRANSRKNSRPIKMTKGGTAGLVDEDDEIPTAPSGWQEVPKYAPRMSSPAPMDIDTETPPAEASNDAASTAPTNGARNINVEPTRPEWRPGNINGNPPPVPPTRPPLHTEAASKPFTGESITNPKPAPAATNPFVGMNGGSEDSEEFRTNFADFKKVEPFTDPKPTGLHSFADLKTTLPFESQPSGQVPLDKPQSVPSLAFPTAPVAPRLPPTMAVSSVRPNNASWRKYAQDFYNYMEKWELFNQKVLDHFTTRQANLIERRQKHGRSWLDGMQGQDGAGLYLVDLEQDHDVRQQWMRACEEHQTRVREFVAFRDRAK